MRRGVGAWLGELYRISLRAGGKQLSNKKLLRVCINKLRRALKRENMVATVLAAFVCASGGFFGGREARPEPLEDQRSLPQRVALLESRVAALAHRLDAVLPPTKGLGPSPGLTAPEQSAEALWTQVGRPPKMRFLTPI